MMRLVRRGLLCAVAVLVPVGTAMAGNLFGWGSGVKGSGELTTVTRQLESFDRIHSSGAFDVDVTVGQEPSVTIEFDDNLIDLIETDVRGGTLHLGSRESYRSRFDCKVKITVPSVERVTVSGSGNVVVHGLTGEVFECKLSGSGSITAEGEVEEFEASISGSGDIDARDLKARSAFARVSGSGEIAVFASDDFDGHVSGSGDIFYYGNPSKTSIDVSGSGRIKAR